MMKFLEAAANWADRAAVDMKFARDDYDGWFAIIHMSDSRGAFSATVNAIPMANETDDEYETRVAAVMSKECAKHRATRITRLTGRSPMARAA